MADAQDPDGDDPKGGRPNTVPLQDKDIATRPKIGRRSALAAVGALAIGAVATVAGSRPAAAQLTDADSGSWADAAGAGRGRGGYRTGLTDADDGNWRDQAGFGRGAPRGSQPAPRYGTGLTDGDSGSWADPGGNGRGRGGYRTGLTDGDTGSWADAAGAGRGSPNR